MKNGEFKNKQKNKAFSGRNGFFRSKFEKYGNIFRMDFSFFFESFFSSKHKNLFFSFILASTNPL
jgi:hypothetical protein